MIESIFMETSETMGIFYDRYRKLPEKINKFLNVIDNAITIAEKETLPDTKAMNITDDLNNFKKLVEIDIKLPDPVDVGEIKVIKKRINDVKSESEKILDRIGVLHRRFKFGTNWIKGILVKPKVYSLDDTSDDHHVKSNQFMRDIGRCMDWAEKITIDLMNLASQDLNILSLVSKVYYRKLYEIADTTNTSNDVTYKSFYNKSDNDKDDDDEKYDILDDKIANINEEFVPVYSIITSYDSDKSDEASEIGKKLIDRGKTISAITRGESYTHTLISFDTSLEHMYHYMGTGFEHDSILTNPSYEVTKSIYINCTFVTKGEAKLISDEIKDFEMHKDKTQYALMHLVNQLFGKTTHQDKRLICSTFVGYLLSRGNLKNLNRDYSLIRPEDITLLPRAFFVISFRDKNDFLERRKVFDERVKNLYNDNIDEIRDYNNILPKILIKNKLNEKGTVEKFFDWIVDKLKIAE